MRRELIAADYVYSIKRHFDPRWKSPTYTTLDNDRILGLDELRQAALRDKKPFDYDQPVEGLRALDRYTIQFKLAAPNPRFADQLSDPARTGAVAREVVELYGDKIMEHPVGTGPYRLARVAAQLADRVREEPELPRRVLRRGGAAPTTRSRRRRRRGSPAASCR